MSAAMFIGTSSGIFTAPMAGTIDTSEKVPDDAICRSGSPSFHVKRVVPSSRPPVAIAIVPASHSSP